MPNSTEHVSSPRELDIKLDALKELVNERHDRYKERDESRQRAVEAAFASSKEAIIKQEEGQKQYNATHNDLTRKMDDQYKQMMPRTEAQAQFQRTDEKFKDIKKEIRGLSESRSQNKGRDTVLGAIAGAILAAIIMFLISLAKGH